MKYITWICIGLAFASCNNQTEAILLNANKVNASNEQNKLEMENKEAYPNCYLKIKVTKEDLALPKLEGMVEVWMKGSKFKMHDQTGRYAHEILGDLTHERGLGQPPASMEEMMDISTRINNPDGQNITIVFDLETMKAMVQEKDAPPSETDAKPWQTLAEQFLSKNVLGEAKDTVFLSKKCKSYTLSKTGEIDGGTYTTIQNFIVFGEYILRHESKDKALSNYSLTWEVVEIKENSVKDINLKP